MCSCVSACLRVCVSACLRVCVSAWCKDMCAWFYEHMGVWRGCTVCCAWEVLRDLHVIVPVQVNMVVWQKWMGACSVMEKRR